VAAGGLIGRGPGLGAPSLVPVAYSDFLFTALSEEYGVVGAVGCLIAIAILVQRGLRAALRSPDSAGRLMAGTLSALLGIQSLLIIGGVLRLLPLTGVTLPFMSYGGSSLLSSMIVLALAAGCLGARPIWPARRFSRPTGADTGCPDDFGIRRGRDFPGMVGDLPRFGASRADRQLPARAA